MHKIFKKLLKREKPGTPPSFLIIGAQKTGTSSLFSYLAKHPMIEPSKQKEIHFFSSAEKRYGKGFNYYHTYFPKTKNLTFEASPSYLMHKQAPKRIFSYNKDIKLIVILRDPVLRAYSAWNMYRKRYQKNREWLFEGYLSRVKYSPDQYQRRNDQILFDFKGYVLEELAFYSKKQLYEKIEAPIIPQGLYAIYLKRYFNLFPRENIMIIENQDLLLNTIDILHRIENFLNLPNYDWKKEKLPLRGKQKYNLQKPLETFNKLYDFYAPYNEELFQLIQTRYDWHLD
ncbi:MAG: sulfotransferase domain-containing protein [Anaerolineaceae bacterium]|nr:sulfotransferase domain-containing protein [Anaerolineaceae bacterium]